MSNTDFSAHDVVSIEVRPVTNHSEGFRWQTIIITTIDGSQHKVTAHLAKNAEGIDPSPKRRVEDVPRQPALIPE